MPDQTDHLFQFTSLSEYTLMQRISIRMADLLFYACIQVIGRTARFEVLGLENLSAVEQAGKVPVICSWHDRVFLGTYFWRGRGIVALTSKSYDGEYISRTLQRFGYGAIRGSSSRGGAAALVSMIREMRSGHPMVFTVDGPRGPRYQAKSGPLLLAKKTGSPILPFIVGTRSYFTVNSWDKMQIPIPFSRSVAIIGEPIYVAADADSDAIETKRELLQKELDLLNLKSEAWIANLN